MVRRKVMALVGLSMAAATAGAADNCSSATPLTLGIAAAGRTDQSTPTAGIPAGHCGGTSARGNDEWFSFTASVEGEYTFSTCDSAFNTVVSLWTGCPNGVRTPVDCNDDACSTQARLVRRMAAGETLLVRVGGRDNLYGEYQIVVDAPFIEPPANDRCEDAATIGVGTVTASTLHATLDGQSECPAYAPDVWYRFTAPSAATFTFSTCETLGYDTALSLFSSCGGAELACSDDSVCRAHANRSSISRAFAAGETVLVRVSGFGDRVGTFVLSIAGGGPPPPPVNDSCAGAIAIGDGQDQPFDTTYATTSGLRLSGCGGVTTMLNDIYYTYTPARSGEATITTCGTGWDTILAVYDRCGGRILACNNNDTRFVCFQSSGQSVVKFQAMAGTTYTVALGSNLVWHDGRGVINVACVSPPGCVADMNDDGFVDHEDYSVFLWCFESRICPPGRTADVNGDGFADFFDYDAFVEAFERGC